MEVHIGASAAARRFSKKSGYTVNESMAHRFKGQPLLLGKKLGEEVQEYILKL